jgi:hypothetical protein
VDGHCAHIPSTAVVGNRNRERNSWRADIQVVVVVVAVVVDLDEEEIAAAHLLGAPAGIRLGKPRCRRSRWMRHDGCS